MIFTKGFSADHISEVGIYKKKTRKHVFDQESDQERKKKRSRSRKNERKHALDQESDQEKRKKNLDRFLGRESVFFFF